MNIFLLFCFYSSQPKSWEFTLSQSVWSWRILRTSLASSKATALCHISTSSTTTAIWQLSGRLPTPSFTLMLIFWWLCFGCQQLCVVLYSKKNVIYKFPFRLARGREEWESAALQNANTKCNGLLPVWGPHVPESAFATCLARWRHVLGHIHRERNAFSFWVTKWILLCCIAVMQAQHISSRVHRPTGAHLPAQHPRHQTAVPSLCYWTVTKCRLWRRGPREQHPPHSLHHPHSALCAQHVRGFCLFVCFSIDVLKLTLATDVCIGADFLMKLVPCLLVRLFSKSYFDTTCTQFHNTNSVPVVHELRHEKRRTCRVSRSSLVRNGWRAPMRLKDRIISPSWPFILCRLKSGGVHVCTSCGDSWSLHILARSLQSPQTSKILKYLVLFCLFFLLQLIQSSCCSFA